MIRINNINIIDKYINIIDDVLICNDKIQYIGKEKIDKFVGEKDYTIIDGSGKFLSPSLVDLHFHLRNPGQSYKQTYKEASDAAIKGGYTKVVAMANTKPVVDKPEIIDEVNEGMKSLPLKVLQASAISKNLSGEECVDFEKMFEKTFLFSDDGKNIDKEEILIEALKKSSDLGFIILDHNEPETEMIKRNLDILRNIKCGRIHFCHVSKKESIEEIKKAKKEKLNISFEVSPHHIFSTNLDYKVNPPIGNDEDNMYILDAIKNNFVDAIATDHAPHSVEDKEKGAPGIANIETAFSMVRKIFCDNNISLQKQIELMSNNPSEIIGVDNRIKEGNVADLIIYNNKKWKINKNKFSTSSKNTPFDNMEVISEIEYTIIGGKIYDNGHS